MCFRRSFQESLQIAEYSVHPLIRQGLLEIHIALPNVRMFRVTILLLSAHPYFELDIEQDGMHKRGPVNQERN